MKVTDAVVTFTVNIGNYMHRTVPVKVTTATVKVMKVPVTFVNFYRCNQVNHDKRGIFGKQACLISYALGSD